MFRKLLIADPGTPDGQSQQPSPQPSSTTAGGILSSSEEETAPLPQPPNNTGVDVLASTDEEPEASTVSPTVVNEEQPGPEKASAPDAQAEAEHAEESSSSGESRSAAEDSGAAALGSPAVRSSPSPPQGFPEIEIVVTAANSDVASSGQPASHTTADAAAGGPSENCPNFDSSGETSDKKTVISSELPVTFRAPSPGTGPGSQNPPTAATVSVDTPHDGPHVDAIPTVSRAILATAAVESTPRGGSDGNTNIFPTSTLMSDHPPAPASEDGSSDHGSEPPAITSLCFSDLGPSIVKWYTGLPAQFLSRYKALSKRPSNHPVSLDELSRNLSLGLVNSTYFCSRKVKNYDGILVLVAGRKTVPVGGGFIGCRGRGGGRAVLPREDPIMIWCDVCFQSLSNLPPRFVFI